MESRRSRHRKCLYCPPHSLPVAVSLSRLGSFGTSSGEPFLTSSLLALVAVGFHGASLLQLGLGDLVRNVSSGVSTGTAICHSLRSCLATGWDQNTGVQLFTAALQGKQM